MPNFESFKEFLDINTKIDHQTRDLIKSVSETHPVIRNSSIAKDIFNNQNSSISLSRVAQLNEIILEQSVRLAKETPSAPLDRCLKIIAEQNVLNVAAITLNSAICAKYESAFDRLSKIMKGQTC